MKQFLILFMIISITSCISVNKNVGLDINDEVIEEIKISKKESFLLGMWDVIDFYIRDSTKSPTCAKDLILWIENIDEESKIFYHSQYKYLKKHEKNLIFITEAGRQDIEGLEVAVYIYYKKVKPNKKVFSLERYSTTDLDNLTP